MAQYYFFSLLKRSLKSAMCMVLLLALQPSLAAEEDQYLENRTLAHPGAELWRNIRQGGTFITGNNQIQSHESGILINASGEAWRQYRMQSLIPTAGTAILVGIILIVIFRLIRGKIKLKHGRSGNKILRFSRHQRIAHWSVAILFILLALTGLLLMFGRPLIIPVIGQAAFSHIAIVAKTLHDYLGPVFALALICLFVLFVRGNMPALRQDLQWVIKGGGIIGNQHVSADRYNAGEKGWFWIATFVGGAIVISGLVLDFPIFEQTRQTMEYYHIMHSTAAMIMILAAFGHIYMGTAAMEGTFEVMQTGYCDENWAKEHHDLWYERTNADGTTATHTTADLAESTARMDSTASDS